jgi:hypothetical protein
MELKSNRCRSVVLKMCKRRVQSLPRFLDVTYTKTRSDALENHNELYESEAHGECATTKVSTTFTKNDEVYDLPSLP